MTRFAIATLLLGLILAGCGAGPTPTTTAPTTAATRAATGASPSARVAGPLTKLTLALGYKPDIQFAPFYVAQERGYFAAEGLDIEFKHGFETDALKLVGTGTLSFGVASGDEVLVARSQGVPVVYVGAWFQKFPITVAALEQANIRSVEDLKGKRIGIPGRFGATYTGLRALLDSAGLRETDVQLQEVGFEQVAALTQGRVDAIVGYINNEPVQLRGQGQAITTINVFDRVNLVANGLVTNEKTIRENPDLVARMVRAMTRGIQETIDRPDEAIDLCIARYIPEAASRRTQVSAVLAASVPLWQSPATARQGLGYSDPAAWAASRDLLRKLGVLGGDVEIDKTFTNTYLPKR